MLKYFRAALLPLPLIMLSCSDSGSPTDGGSSPVTISVADVSVTEGAVALFTISLNRAADSLVTFQYATSNGTAIAPGDYIAIPSTTDTIQVGATSFTVSVTTIDDAAIESSETFSLVVSNISGAVKGDTVGVATISDNDGASVSFASDLRPLLNSNCALIQCHGGSATGGFDIGTASNTIYTALINATGTVTMGLVVVPGNSGTSNFYLKTRDSWPFGVRMPSGLAALSIADQRLIKDWIDQGAQNN